MRLIQRGLGLLMVGAAVLWLYGLVHGFSGSYCFDTVPDEGCGASVQISGHTVLWLAPLVIIASAWASNALHRAALRHLTDQHPGWEQ